MEKKSYLITALVLVSALSGGVYAYTYSTGTGTIGITDPTGDIATVNATATQPDWDTVVTPVTDTSNYRPNAVGDETDIKYQYPDAGAHWDKVDEETADGDSTYVYTPSLGWEEDLYHITDHSTQTVGGDINYVEVYMVCRAADNFTQESAYVHIKTNGTEYNSASENLTTSYATYSYQWTNNPSTNTTWTWNGTDNLQIGNGMREAGVGIESWCTQVYAEVSFDAPSLSGNTPTGDLFEVTEDSDYNGDLAVRVYLTNTADLQKAYEELNIELYLEDSEEAGETPNYQLLTLENGVATFTLKDPISNTHTLSVTGGNYTLTSRETSEWEAGWTVTPELFCEATQR